MARSSLVVGTALHIVGCLAASLVSTHWTPVASPSCDTDNCSLGGKMPPAKNHWNRSKWRGWGSTWLMLKWKRGCTHRQLLAHAGSFLHTQAASGFRGACLTADRAQVGVKSAPCTSGSALSCAFQLLALLPGWSQLEKRWRLTLLVPCVCVCVCACVFVYWLKIRPI